MHSVHKILYIEVENPVKGIVEDSSEDITLDKTVAQNQNIIWKWCLSMLKLIEICRQKISLKSEWFDISLVMVQIIEEFMQNKK